MGLPPCDGELISLPASIQPQGALLVLREPEFEILQVSQNLGQFVDLDPGGALGEPLEKVIGRGNAAALKKDADLAALDDNPLYLRTIKLETAGRVLDLHAIAHRHDGALIIELEPASPSRAGRDGEDRVSFQNLYPLVREFLSRMRAQGDVVDLCNLAAQEVRRITGFDRVLISRFEPDWSGAAIAEDSDGALPSLRDHRFPATDLPRPARDLYERNRLRVIADAEYRPVPLVPRNNPLTGKPLDLSFATLCGEPPMHLEHLKNMGVRASMSISLLREGKLWGLISAHHASAQSAAFESRIACDLLGQALSVQLESVEHNADIRHRLELRTLQTRLLTAMANKPLFTDGLVLDAQSLMNFVAAGGAAVVFRDDYKLVGRTPPEPQVRRMVNWIARGSTQEVFHTDCLSSEFPEAADYADMASGVLAISISKLHQAYILWFRPERVQTLQWAGSRRQETDTPQGPHLAPQGQATPQGPGMHPHQSFQVWKETMRCKSAPWLPAEIDASIELRNSVVGIVLRRAEELAELSSDLERSNKELEAFSYSVSHDLRAPIRHITGFAALLGEFESERLSAEGKRYLQTIIDSAKFAGTLVDNLLTYSQMGRNQLHKTHIDMDQLVAEARTMAQETPGGNHVQWIVHPLPPAMADPITLRLVWQNLISNAIKYSHTREKPLIEIGARQERERNVYWVRDNGIGFDMAYVDKLFGVFQRLHRIEDFEGTGIGLANVNRIVTRHGGTAWAQGEVDRGATFSFALPAENRVGHAAHQESS